MSPSLKFATERLEAFALWGTDFPPETLTLLEAERLKKLRHLLAELVNAARADALEHPCPF